VKKRIASGTMNLYGCANGKAAQPISFLEKRVHASGVHQGNEDFCPAALFGAPLHIFLPRVNGLV
jgi:hypothetical protein